MLEEAAVTYNPDLNSHEEIVQDFIEDMEDIGVDVYSWK